MVTRQARWDTNGNTDSLVSIPKPNLERQWFTTRAKGFLIRWVVHPIPIRTEDLDHKLKQSDAPEKVPEMPKTRRSDRGSWIAVVVDVVSCLFTYIYYIYICTYKSYKHIYIYIYQTWTSRWAFLDLFSTFIQGSILELGRQFVRFSDAPQHGSPQNKCLSTSCSCNLSCS